MAFWKKRKKNFMQMGDLLKAALRPTLCLLLPMFVKTIDLWKVQVLDQIPKVSTEDLEDFLSDQIDSLSASIARQIKKVIEK